QLPPTLRRVDAGSVPPLGRQDRAKHRRLDQRRARQQAPIPNRGSAPASAFCAPIAASTRPASRRSRPAPSNWASSTASSSRRCSPASSIAGRGQQPRHAHRRRQSARSPLLQLTGNPTLAHPTLDQSHALGLYGVAKGFKDLEHNAEARGLDHAEWLGLLLEYELTLRRQKQFETRARVARLRHPASVEDVNYQSPRGLDRALFLKLSTCDWIAERRNLLLTGASGLGKSWLACALGHKACRENVSVLYTRMPRLFADLA